MTIASELEPGTLKFAEIKAFISAVFDHATILKSLASVQSVVHNMVRKWFS